MRDLSVGACATGSRCVYLKKSKFARNGVFVLINVLRVGEDK